MPQWSPRQPPWWHFTLDSPAGEDSLDHGLLPSKVAPVTPYVHSGGGDRTGPAGRPRTHLGHSSLEGGARPPWGQASGGSQRGGRLPAAPGEGHLPEKSPDGAQPACWEERKLAQRVCVCVGGGGTGGFGSAGPAPTAHPPGQRGRRAAAVGLAPGHGGHRKQKKAEPATASPATAPPAPWRQLPGEPSAQRGCSGNTQASQSDLGKFPHLGHDPHLAPAEQAEGTSRMAWPAVPESGTPPWLPRTCLLTEPPRASCLGPPTLCSRAPSQRRPWWVEAPCGDDRERSSGPGGVPGPFPHRKLARLAGAHVHAARKPSPRDKQLLPAPQPVSRPPPAALVTEHRGWPGTRGPACPSHTPLPREVGTPGRGPSTAVQEQGARSSLATVVTS